MNDQPLPQYPHDDDQPLPGQVEGGQVVTWHVTHAQAGQRLDAAIASHLGLSRQQARTLLDQQVVQLNGRNVGLGKKGLLLPAGMVIAVQMPEVTGEKGQWRVIPQPDVTIRVIASGDGWVMVDKPAGMAVHPLVPDETGTVLNTIITQYPQMAGVGEGGLRSGVVHRLDVETSGCLVLATREDTWRAMRQAFADHHTTKMYAAIVRGQMEEQGQAVTHLVVSQHRPAKVKVLEQASRESRQCDLSWRVVRRLRDACVVHVELGTGFLHQIRVMLADRGHAVLGDKVYGQGDAEQVCRLMLHAHQLRVLDATGESPLPEEFQQCIGQLS